MIFHRSSVSCRCKSEGSCELQRALQQPRPGQTRICGFISAYNNTGEVRTGDLSNYMYCTSTLGPGTVARIHAYRSLALHVSRSSHSFSSNVTLSTCCVFSIWLVQISCACELLVSIARSSLCARCRLRNRLSYHCKSKGSDSGAGLAKYKRCRHQSSPTQDSRPITSAHFQAELESIGGAEGSEVG